MENLAIFCLKPVAIPELLPRTCARTREASTHGADALTSISGMRAKGISLNKPCCYIYVEANQH
jgi:hypothetical protein